MRPIQAETETERIVPMRYIAPSIEGEVTLQEQSWEPVPMKQVGCRIPLDEFEALVDLINMKVDSNFGREHGSKPLTNGQVSRMLSHLVREMLDKVASGGIRLTGITSPR